MPLYREPTLLGDYKDFDWSVWFNNTHLIASYDSSHTVYLRQTGEEIIHTYSLEEAKAATGLADDTIGESYATGY